MNIEKVEAMCRQFKVDAPVVLARITGILKLMAEGSEAEQTVVNSCVAQLIMQNARVSKAPTFGKEADDGRNAQ